MKSKSALRVCLSLFICFALLIGAESMLPTILTLHPEWYAIGLDVLSMFLPIALLHILMPKKEVFRPKLKVHFQAEMLGLTVCASFAVTHLRFLCDYLMYRMAQENELKLSFSLLEISFGNTISIFAVLAAIILPAFMEELYLRGYIQTFLSTYLSTKQVLLIMTILNAMLYASMMKFPGALLMSAMFSWLAFVFGSFWYAVFAHMVSAIQYLFLQWLMIHFINYGILKYLPALSLIFCLLFLYIGLRIAERLMLRQAFKKLHYVQHSDYSFTKFVGNAAALAFLFVFIAKAVIGII